MEGSQKRTTAIVVGAGVGGVAIAARLAKTGFHVIVVEKNSFTGGRCSTIHHNAYRFDQGPSLLLMPHFFTETFRDLDTSLEAEGVKLLKCEPNYNVWFEDGELLELSTDIVRMKNEIEKWEGKDGLKRYLGFLQESNRHFELSIKHVLRRNFTSSLSMVRPEFLKHLLALHPFESAYSRASKYFWTDRLRKAFTFGSMYIGMSPFDAPGTYNLLQYTELAEGIWYPEGGFHKIVKALVNIGEKLGVEYRLSSPVNSISLASDGKTATGVELATGETIRADIVVCNADLVYAYNSLLPRTSYAEALSKRPCSCSSISFYWALDRKIDNLQAHNIFLTDEYRESFNSIFKQHELPTSPSFYVNVPSRVDPTAAPPGKDAIVALVPVGHLLDNPKMERKEVSGPADALVSVQDWPAMTELARQKIISTILARTGVDLSPLILHEDVNTPRDWQRIFNLDKGAILGLSHSIFNVLSFRPKTKHPKIKGLYFVGASTQPGTGVPICLAGAKIVSEQILGHCGVEIPWAQGERIPKEQDIGRMQIRPLLSWFHVVTAAILALLAPCALGQAISQELQLNLTFGCYPFGIVLALAVVGISYLMGHWIQTMRVGKSVSAE